MAVLEKIRNRGVLLLVVVGAALLMFIVGDFVNSGSTYFQESRANVAKINGEKVKIMDFQQNVDQFTKAVEVEYGSVTGEMSEQIRQMVWDNTVRNTVVANECEKIGMTVTENELSEIIIGNHPSPILRSLRMFADENGNFDVNSLKQFLTAIDSEDIASQIPYDQLEKYKNYWRYWEKAIKNERLNTKYVTLLSKSMVANPLEAKYAYNNNKTSATVVYAMKNYMAIADSTIAVSDSEIKALYNKKKNQFKQQASADISYIAVAIRPSKEDYADAEAWINDLKAEFETTGNVADVVNSNSDIAYRSENLSKEQVDKDFAEFAFSGETNQVMGPILVGDTYKMARIVERGVVRPDSVKLSHIYLRRESAKATQDLADSIETAIKGGADFAALAATHSLAQSAKQGGEIGWLTEQGLDAKIADPAFTTPVNGTFQVKEGNDINLFLVTEVTKKVEKVKLAVIQRAVDASSHTRTDLYNKLKEYIVSNNTLQLFNDNAAAAGYTVASAQKVSINATAINNISNAREAVRWVFDNKANTVSDVFEFEGNIVAVSSSRIYEEGFASIEDVRPQLMAEIRKDKKAETLLAEAGSKSVSELATMGYMTDTLQNVSFGSNYAGSIGNEPALFAKVGKYTEGQEVPAMKGNNGVFAFKVVSKTDSEQQFNEKQEMVMLTTRESYPIQYLYLEALKEAANIKDFRYKYY